jgi:phosphoribosyl 1,2-cyclic phosphodiesterase
MKIYFWGSRGSLPVTLTAKQVRSKILAALQEAVHLNLSSDDDIERFIDEKLPFPVRGSYGGNTSCVEIKGGEEFVLCDAGTGLRDFGNYIMGSGNGGKQTYNIFLSHMHWDHIQGFPFFIPAYIPGNRVNIFSFHREFEDVMQSQQHSRTFPVPLEYMQAEKNFILLEPDREYDIAGFSVKGIKQNHPGDSYGYCFERQGKKIVYSTDSEHREDVWDGEQKLINFFRNADLLIFDAQYSFLDSAHMKESWGHSSNILGVELSVAADVKRLCLYHNEPTCDDATLDKFLHDTRHYLKIFSDISPLKIDLAFDGLELDI